MTNPSRSRSKGRLDVAGSSLRVLRTRIHVKAPKTSGESGASAPPASITGTRPSWIIRAASPIATIPAAQELPLARDGPVRPISILMLDDAAPPNTDSASIGFTELAPFDR